MTEEVIGNAKGGYARAEALTPERRLEISKEANEARKILKAKKGKAGILKLGNAEIPCFVLDDENETRVISQRGMISSLGMATGGKHGDDRLTNFLQGNALSPFVSNDLTVMTKNPIKFRPPHGGKIAYGYPAVVIPKICKAVLAASRAQALHKRQEHIVAQCIALDDGLGEIGIIALVDEATGFQKDRARDALAQILEAYVAKALQPYLRTFELSFYESMYRLKGKVLKIENGVIRTKPYVGHWINDIIYHRLAPGVLAELKKVNPKLQNGRRNGALYKYLTQNKGYPDLRYLLGSVETLMEYSSTWDEFKEKLDKKHRRWDMKGAENEFILESSEADSE